MTNRWKTLVAFVVLGAVSIGLLWGMDAVSARLIRQKRLEQAAETFAPIFDAATRYEPIDTDDRIREAYRVYRQDTLIGYAVTVGAIGYGGEIEVHVGLDHTAARFAGLRIGSHRESEGYGAGIVKPAFYDQFTDLAAPAAVDGYVGIITDGSSAYADGTYTAADPTFSNGWRAFVKLTVQDGRITAVDWDADPESGDLTKKQLAAAGEYTMTEDGKRWDEQAATMEQALIRVQDPMKLVMDTQTGKTDAYTGVSIKIDEFVRLASQALDSARGSGDGTAVDGVSGATVSSKAVIKAANTAYVFVWEAYGKAS